MYVKYYTYNVYLRNIQRKQCFKQYTCRQVNINYRVVQRQNVVNKVYLLKWPVQKPTHKTRRTP